MTQTTMKAPKWMADYDVVYGEDTASETETSLFGSLLDSAQQQTFAEGEVLKGTVLRITDDFVTVDIGYKQEGLVFRKEFCNHDDELTISEGDQVDVYLEKLESAMGNLVLSRDKAEILKAWDNISEACEKGTPVQGTVISKVKGGLSIDIGVKAFLPGSQMDIRPIRNLDKFIGERMEFKVIKFNKKRGNIVLSRRAILQEERDKLRGETLGMISEGMVVRGTVKNITDYGAFIDLGGVDGLLHITDMSWGRVKHPENILSVGQETEVKILKFDESKGRVSLGLKQIQPNPWDSIESIYPVGTVIKGEVVSIKDYGIFLEMSDGIEGLIHVSESTWSSRPKHPSKYVSVGEDIQAKVLEVDVANEKISLSLRQTQPNPWDTLETKYPLNSKVKGVVKSIVDFGVFVDIQEEVDALIHISDISWTKKNINLNSEFKEGEEVETIVLSVDKASQKFSLGVKQLHEDPWLNIENRFPIGSVVETQVLRVTDFGAFVELETNIEGLIHISEFSEERVEQLTSDVIKKGDQTKAMIISVDKEAQKIALSIKAISQEENKKTIAFENKQQDEVKAATLGDKLKDIIKRRSN